MEEMETNNQEVFVADADNTAGRNSKDNKTPGTAVCKVLDYTIAMTSMKEKHAMLSIIQASSS